MQNDESVAKAIGIKLPNGTIVSSTRANMENMARDKGEKISDRSKRKLPNQR